MNSKQPLRREPPMDTAKHGFAPEADCRSLLATHFSVTANSGRESSLPSVCIRVNPWLKGSFIFRAAAALARVFHAAVAASRQSAAALLSAVNSGALTRRRYKAVTIPA